MLDKNVIRKKYHDLKTFHEKETGKHRCACGCNEVIVLKDSHFWNGIPKYIFGHAARLRIGGPSYDKSVNYSVEDIARVGNISEQTVRLWARKGKIKPAKTIGRKNLFLKSDIDAFLNKRPKRVPFKSDQYASVQELKKMGVSRSKLRALVRSGHIQDPRIYARKTNYLLEDIQKYWNQIQEDRKRKHRRRVSVAAFKDMQNRLAALEQKIGDLETALASKPKKISRVKSKQPGRTRSRSKKP
ncbi:helix-turn-helix domain-containing protein [bacterium]|nr:helix-turn-helix domain-containing protein [candidate division CSSED10-310 bacterium]